MSHATRLVLAAAFVATASASSASEAEYLQRFQGSFQGGGKVRTEAEGSPYNVKCKISGSATDTSVNLDGSCTALAIVSRKIGANLKVSPDGTYSGVYTGSKIGPAAIKGRRNGDTVVLTVTWPKPVNGDTNATMTISNSGSGFTFAVDDKGPSGSNVRMTDVSLKR